MFTIDWVPIVDRLQQFGTALAVLGLIAGAFWVFQRRLIAVYGDRPLKSFQRQAITLGVALFAVVLAVVLMPIGDAMRGQLLSLIGLLLSAVIALGSTTVVGNAMAGLMLRWMRPCSAGQYIVCGEHSGRVSRMDLLSCQLQTEDRNLTTVPNLYMVTHPVMLLPDSGTILHVEVSLGYDVGRTTIEKLLIEAAERSGLETPFVQISELGDYSVTYRISGLLTEVKQLIAKRRQLRANTLDTLHEAGIEIVSPSFMNQRPLDPAIKFIPKRSTKKEKAGVDATSPDSVVFDKAEAAHQVEELRKTQDELIEEKQELEAELKRAREGQGEKIEAELVKVTLKAERLTRTIERAQEELEE